VDSAITVISSVTAMKHLNDHAARTAAVRLAVSTLAILVALTACGGKATVVDVVSGQTGFIRPT
jgi:hypothetical protein